MSEGYYSTWATSPWLTFWDKDRSGRRKDNQRLNIDREHFLSYFTIKTFPKASLIKSIKVFNRNNSKNIDIDSKEAKELQEIFDMFIQDVDSEWEKKEQ